jgi:hypothetical protein
MLAFTPGYQKVAGDFFSEVNRVFLPLFMAFHLHSNQFLISRHSVSSASPSMEWEGWKVYFSGPLQARALPGSVLFLGDVVDVNHPEHSLDEIIAGLPVSATCDAIVQQTFSWMGYFLLMFRVEDTTCVITDAAGQLEVFGYEGAEGFAFASHSTVISHAFPATQVNDSSPQDIIQKEQVLLETTPWRNVKKLIPNHMYRVSGGLPKERFFPSQPLPTLPLEEATEKAAAMLAGGLRGWALKSPLALALTAGLDSRVLLAACAGVLDRVALFVLNHPHESGKVDIEVARKIARHMGKELHIVHYTLGESNPALGLYPADTYMHTIQKAIGERFPDHVLINGNVSEVARTFYQPLPKNLSVDDLLYVLGVPNTNFSLAAFSAWWEEVKYLQTRGIDPLDLLYWEHKMPNWAGRSKSITYLYAPVVAPFNCHALLQTLLSVDTRHRDKTKNLLYEGIIGQLAPSLNTFPINPTKKGGGIRVLKKLRLYKPYRYLFFKWRLLKF